MQTYLTLFTINMTNQDKMFGAAVIIVLIGAIMLAAGAVLQSTEVIVGGVLTIVVAAAIDIYTNYWLNPNHNEPKEKNDDK